MASTPGAQSTLRDYLDTPYILFAESVRIDGRWVRKAAFPELEGCFVIGPSTWEAVVELERLLPRYLVERLAAGEDVPRPDCRATVGDITAEERLLWAGLPELQDRLDQPVAALAAAEPIYEARIEE